MSRTVFELTVRRDDPALNTRSFHVTEADAKDAALAYVREELEPLADDDGVSLLDKFNLAVERDGVEEALDAAVDEYGPEISYEIEEVLVPTDGKEIGSDLKARAATVPTFEQLLAWCEEFDGDPTEGWLHRILTGEISVDDFNRAVLTGTAPEGV